MNPKISIIIPVLNEELEITNFLTNLKNSICNEKINAEIIIVDGRSRDNSIRIINDYNKKNNFRIKVNILPEKEKVCRATQLNYGTKFARGKILLFLHIDTIIPVKALSQIKNVIKKGVNGGAFDIKFYPKNIRMSIIETLYRLLLFFTKNFFGDQGIFVTRDFFKKIGGYPEIAFMEDLKFSDQIRKSKKYTILKTKVTTSSRRFYKNGFFKQMCLNIYIYNYFRFFKGNTDKMQLMYNSLSKK